MYGCLGFRVLVFKGGLGMTAAILHGTFYTFVEDVSNFRV